MEVGGRTREGRQACLLFYSFRLGEVFAQQIARSKSAVGAFLMALQEVRFSFASPAKSRRLLICNFVCDALRGGPRTPNLKRKALYTIFSLCLLLRNFNSPATFSSVSPDDVRRPRSLVSDFCSTPAPHNGDHFAFPAFKLLNAHTQTHTHTHLRVSPPLLTASTLENILSCVQFEYSAVTRKNQNDVHR